MGTFRLFWTSSMVWIPVPFRLVVFTGLVLVLVLQVVPRLARVGGLGLQRSEPVVALLTYPEYLATSLARHLGRPLLPGTIVYGQALGALARLLTQTGHVLARAGEHRRRVRLKVVVAIAVVAGAIWYSADTLPPGEFGDNVRDLRSGLVTADTWLMTGVTGPVPATGCVPIPTAPRPSTPARRSPTPSRRNAPPATRGRSANSVTGSRPGSWTP